MAINLFTGSAATPSHLEVQALLHLYQQGDLENARFKAEALTKKFPKHALGWSILGAIFRARREHGDALPHLKKAAEINPGDASAHFNLANTLRDLGRPEEASRHYHRALKLKPDLPHGFFHLGNMQQDMGQMTMAERSFRKALEFTPNHIESLSNLACLLQDCGRLSEALELSHRALEIQPANAALHYNHCDLLLEMGLLDQAENAARKTMALAPDMAQTHALMANVLKARSDLDGAVYAYLHALSIEPDNTDIHSSLLFTLSYLPAWNQADTLKHAKTFGRTCSEKAKKLSREWAGETSPQVLRVGLVSADLRNHPVGHFLEGVLGNTDPARIELVALSAQDFEDELTRRIRPAFSEWHSLAGMPDHEAALMIRRLGLHLVLDLSGHTAGNRLPLFAYRLAPVQATWLGYFATTGVREMDYLIADPVSLPARCESHFTETIWRLPDTRLCFTPPSIVIDVNPLPALSSGVVTFGSTSNLLKLNDKVIALWSRILNDLPKSRLLLQAKQLNHADAKNMLLKRFGTHGVPAERIILEAPAERQSYLHTYHRVDICLDPFPFPGGTTTAESLWMGVPVLTLDGDHFLARQGSALMTTVGLEEWVAKDEEDYLARAIQHSQSIESLAHLRQNLRSNTLATALFDAPRFARNLETALWGMWTKHKQTISPT
ncbi:MULTISPECIES: tetratricopeptide repeat protein [unclassified Acidovorax]|uniref:O-linked N-acetylglucosamine transferase, SPINDLY family protein n=1 Tax=unclassified Acidovorax TaxID=2684926 RepID=UPI001304A848|nr:MULTISPECIES: tetratricopeptide repeat protein [unclassified Acidovorax]MDH4418745.1 tetratricopeptide repeat protein [Acidovorax sp.]